MRARLLTITALLALLRCSALEDPSVSTRSPSSQSRQDELTGHTWYHMLHEPSGPSNTSTVDVPVCFIEEGWGANPPTYWRSRFATALAGTWMKPSYVRFTDFSTCANPSLVPTVRVRLKKFVPGDCVQGTSCATADVGASALKTTGYSALFVFDDTISVYYFRYYVVHEMGHVLGFQHEQDSPFRTASCSSIDAWTGMAAFGSTFDARSVMMSNNGTGICDNFFSNGRGYLSVGDIEGVRRAYGTKVMTARGDMVGRRLKGTQVPGPPDGVADIGVYRPSTGEWIVPGDFTVVLGGQAGDVPIQADFNGDGKTDKAIYRPSDCGGGCLWLVLLGSAVNQVRWGQPGDFPVVMDINGDGATSLGVFRPSSQTWYISSGFGGSSDAYLQVWGSANSVPVPADYDGDGRSDFAVWNPDNGSWSVSRDNGAYNVTGFGTAGDVPVPMDYSGEGIVRPALWRPAAGKWLFKEKLQFADATYNAGAGYYELTFGQSTDVPIPGSYRGVGIAEPLMYRTAGANVGKVITTVSTIQAYGTGTDIPLPINRFRTAPP